MASSVFRISRSSVPYGTSVLDSDMLTANIYIVHLPTGRLSTPLSKLVLKYLRRIPAPCRNADGTAHELNLAYLRITGWMISCATTLPFGKFFGTDCVHRDVPGFSVA